MIGAGRTDSGPQRFGAGAPGTIGSGGDSAQVGAVGGPASPPTVSLPKGGGAIRTIGEKFSANPVTGTGSMSVPIYASPGRSGFGPELSLTYDSGSGNGPFGFGWALAVPSITRKTDKGLPKYRDADESDVYLLSGADDLVPVLRPDGGRFEDANSSPGYTIHRYRPRIEGLFARIERWTRQEDGDVHWRSITRDNVLTIYGKDENSRIADPADPGRIFTWLMCETRDDKGNAALYEYKPEDGAGVDLTQAHERNRGERGDTGRRANRYLKRIRYGNRVPLLDQEGRRPRFLGDAQIQDAGWMFEVVFDYGEHDADVPKPDDAGEWAYREDPFSSYRAGFEVRTCRLCRRVLMFHHFESETGVGNACLVRSTDLTYSGEQEAVEEAPNPAGYALLLAATQSGYKRSNGGYLKRSLPPVEFEYTRPTVQDTVSDVDAESLKNLPAGLDDTAYRWIDLHGEGIPGILIEQGGAWFYKRNLSPINVDELDPTTPIGAKFAPIELVARKPNVALAGGRTQFVDLAGDGRPDAVVMEGPMAGLYEHDGDEGWQPYRPFSSRLNRNAGDPNLKFVDLDGDGRADVLITEDEAFVWHPSLAEMGFGPAERFSQAIDEERGPRLIFASDEHSIYLADLSGDGLTDLVRLRNGEVCYWPNLGYGRFGAKVTMDDPPWFDGPEIFDHRRVLLADIDGSGTADIIYLGLGGVRLYFNLSGNRWSRPRRLDGFPPMDSLSSVVAADLLGNGTACLVWSTPLPVEAERQMHYVDLMGGQKPYLLVKSTNNLGAETWVRYAPSTKFYLEDKLGGKPWIERLPFPVHVVERVETCDRVSHNRFVTRYAYHHGHFDGEEREFRGFGMVEQLDTEEFAALSESGQVPAATNFDETSHVPPVLTKTWFHTGAYLGRDHISDFFAGLLDEEDPGGYYREPGLTDEQARALLLPDTVLPEGLTPEEEREACRALKGSMLRQEVYALDGSATQDYPSGHPYAVTEQNLTVERLQTKGENRHAIFFAHAREAIGYQYERDPDDPRVQHALTLEVDGFGNVLKGAAVGYGRRRPDMSLSAADRAKQTQTLVTHTENRFTNSIDTADDYRAPLPAETRTYELTGLILPDGRSRFTMTELLNAGASAEPIAYERAPTPGLLQGRLIEHSRTLYRRDDLTGALPLGGLQSLALPFEGYSLAFTPGLLAGVYGEWVSDATLETEGGYVHTEGDTDWWIPSGMVFYSPNTADAPSQELAYAREHFFLPHRYRDPFHTDTVGTETFVGYDAYDLLIEETRDAIGNRVTVGERDVDPTQPLIRHGQDYRALQPAFIMDPNRNRSAVSFDVLGMVVGTAVMGKEGEDLGDLLQDFDADPPLADLQAFVANPQSRAAALLGKATARVVYDLSRYHRAGQPPFAATLARETHLHDLDGTHTEAQISFSYSDGFGREIQKKVQAEAGDAPQRQAHVPLPTGDVSPGELVRDEQGRLVQSNAPRRWVGSGRTVFNNKGKPIRQYEPFFSATHLFEPERDMTDTGVSPLLFYDPVERVVATVHPNHAWEKVVYGPWRQATYDVNDTVLNVDGSTDPGLDRDVGGFFARLPEADYLPTWYEQRSVLAADDPERVAADKAAVHGQTPTVTHGDPLGRPFLTIALNRFGQDGVIVEGKTPTRVELDIEGNQRAVRDAIVQNGDERGRLVVRYDYDMLGNRIHQASMEAGERWMLNDVTGKPILAWDSRDFTRRMAYDELRRPTATFVTENGVERLDTRTVYGEDQGTADNHRTHVFRTFDGAGVVTSEAYDFKGNLLRSHRGLLPDYKQAVDWQQEPVPNDGTFTSSTTYDALNRPTSVTTPDGSVYRPTYNEASLLDRVDVSLRGAAATTTFVANIDYDAKGQRELIAYGNGVRTRYEYDPLTFRLNGLRTTRPAAPNGLASQLFTDPSVMQDLRYTYDPAGNITRIEDAALNTVFHDNERVQPVCVFTYDSLYRLIEAKGREHIGQTAFNFDPPDNNRRDFPFAGPREHPNDMQAMRNYTEGYEHDEVGNILSMRHSANDGGGWTRGYEYDEASLLEEAKKGNRLTKTSLGGSAHFIETYAYADAQGNDADGCTTAINDMRLVWDSKDQLQRVDLGGGGTAYYVYDGGGQRVRKVIETQNGTRKEERLYLDGFEMYREYETNGATVTLERETLHIMDDEQRIALVETRTLDTSGDDTASQLTRYQLGNHLGSASLELDESGGLITYEEYHPYGTTAFQAGRSVAEVSLKRYRYTAMERDEETGLAYHAARYLAPWLGRWVSCDPAGLEGGLNAYGFGKNNPLVFVDSGGLSPEQWSGGVTDIAEAGQSGLNLEKDNFWTYTDEAGDIWNLVDIYGEQQETELKEVQTKTGGGLKFDVWSFWLFKREEVTTTRYLVPVTTSRQVLQDRVWIKATPEVIEISGSAPKEEEDHWYSPSNLLKLGLDLWSPTGKAKYLKWGVQFAVSWYENGSAIQAAKDVTINGIKNKALDTVLDKSLDLLMARLGGKVRMPGGTHLALGRSETLEEFAGSQRAVSIFGAYDKKYFVAAADPQIFKNQFDDIVGLFVNNGGRIKFNLSGMKGTRLDTVTSWELQRILGSDTLRSKTDFFENGVKLTGKKLERRLAPWRR